MRDIKKIVVHCSAGNWGDMAYVDKLHKKRGFVCNGYHFGILNGYVSYETWKSHVVDVDKIGKIEHGRPLSMMGAHAEKDNKDSIGVVLFGMAAFHPEQLSSMFNLFQAIEQEVGHELEIVGHYELESGKKQGKTCPNLDMEEIRSQYCQRKTDGVLKEPDIDKESVYYGVSTA